MKTFKVATAEPSKDGYLRRSYTYSAASADDARAMCGEDKRDGETIVNVWAYDNDGRQVEHWIEQGGVSLKPKWASAMRILIMALENGTPEGKEAARAELMDLARRLDEHGEGK